MIRGALRWLSRAAANWRYRLAGVPPLSPEQRAEIAAAETRRQQALDNPALSPLERLIHWWGKDAKANVAEADLQALETRYAIRLPGDFRAYLMATMPTGNEWDSEGTN